MSGVHRNFYKLFWTRHFKEKFIQKCGKIAWPKQGLNSAPVIIRARFVIIATDSLMKEYLAGSLGVFYSKRMTTRKWWGSGNGTLEGASCQVLRIHPLLSLKPALPQSSLNFGIVIYQAHDRWAHTSNALWTTTKNLALFLLRTHFWEILMCATIFSTLKLWKTIIKTSIFSRD